MLSELVSGLELVRNSRTYRRYLGALSAFALLRAVTAVALPEAGGDD